MKFNKTKFLRIVKTAVRFGYLFFLLWIAGALLFSIFARGSIKYFSEALWLLLICLTGSIPDVLVGITNLPGRIIAISFTVLGLILVSILVGRIATFFIESLLTRNSLIIKITNKKKIQDHIVFLGFDKFSASILMHLQSLYLTEKIPMVVVTEKNLLLNLPALDSYENIFWVKNNPFFISSWELANLRNARSVYLSRENVSLHGKEKDEFFVIFKEVVKGYLGNNGPSEIAMEEDIYIRNSGYDVRFFRKDTFSNHLISSSIVSPLFSVALNAIAEHKAKSEIYVLKKKFQTKFDSSSLLEFQDYLCNNNIEFLGYLMEKGSSDDDVGIDLKLNPTVKNLEEVKVGSVGYVVLVARPKEKLLKTIGANEL